MSFDTARIPQSKKSLTSGDQKVYHLPACKRMSANVAEAQQGQSSADFISKMNIALKEAAETKYWIRLLVATGYLTEIETKSILSECIEIEKILYSIVRTSKTKQ